jgi:Fur family ferric uptake transcriptional regulator/Fur family peroxide stress response transcriptional regulator
MMDHKEKIFAGLRAKNIRITKQRRDIIDVLENNHLTISEIHIQLSKKGRINLATIYNNIDFLLAEKLIHQLLINDKKYYSFALDEKDSIVESNIHITVENDDRIFDVSDVKIIDYLKNHPAFKNYIIKSLQIVVKGEPKKTKALIRK